MVDHQRFLDDIQSAVYSQGTADPDLLRDAAAEYAEACEQVNARLRRIGDLLRKGLRSEAIQQAEEEPNVVDQMAMLDFPEHPQWCELLKGWDMALPPPVLLDVAAELNEAYAVEEPLQELLKKHRLLALARAPLPERIGVLRSIRSFDEFNPAWQEDQESLEKARLKQTESEAEKAAKRGDLETLAVLAKELRHGDWLSKPEDALVLRVEGLHRTVAAYHARSELGVLEQKLNAAHAAFDAEAGHPLRERWEVCARIAELPSDDPLAERAEPALQWLADQDDIAQRQRQYDQDVLELEHALDDSESSDVLEKIFHAVARHEDGLPSRLQARYQQRIDEFQLSSRRKHRMVLVGVVGIILVIGLSIGTVISRQSHNRRVAGSAAALRKLVNEDRLDEAVRYHRDLSAGSPGVAASAEVQQEKGRLDGALREEQDRKAAFERAIVQAEQAAPERRDAAAIAEARKTAKTEEERTRLAELISRLSAVRRQKEEVNNKQFQATFDKFLARVEHLESSKASEEELTDAALRLLLSEVQSGIDGSYLVSPSLRLQAKPLALRVRALLETMRIRRDLRRSQVTITQAVGNPKRYATVLQQFVERFPRAGPAAAYQQVLDEALLWEGIAKWSEFTGRPEFRRPHTIGDLQAAFLLDQGDRLVSEHGEVPVAEFFTRRKQFLRAIAARQGKDGTSLVKSARDLFSDPLIKDLWIIEKTDGTVYYLTRKPDFAGADEATPVRFSYLTGFDLSTRETGVFNRDVAHGGPAPQSVIAEQASDSLRELDDSKWEATFSRIIRDILQQERLDPILKLIMLQRVVEPASKGSAALAEAFARYRTALNELNVDLSVEWMLPKDEAAQTARRQAEAVLDKMPNFDDAVKQSEEKRQEFLRPPKQEYQWIGWLDRDLRGQWKCSRPEPKSITGDLVIIRRSLEHDGATFDTVGTIVRGVITWVEDSPIAFVEGRPIYLRTNSETAGESEP